MTNHTLKTLPSLFAALVGAALVGITHSLVGGFVFAALAVVQYMLRDQPLNHIMRLAFTFGASLSLAIALKSVIIGMFPIALLCLLMGVFCISVLFARP